MAAANVTLNIQNSSAFNSEWYQSRITVFFISCVISSSNTPFDEVWKIAKRFSCNCSFLIYIFVGGGLRYSSHGASRSLHYAECFVTCLLPIISFL